MRNRCFHSSFHPFLHSVMKWIVVAMLTVAIPVYPADLSAKQILAKAGANYDAVKDYTVDARLTVNSPQLHIPNMQITLYYKKPDKIHVDSKDGFAMLPKQGAIVGNPLKELLAGSDLIPAGSQKVLGEDCHVIKGTFRKDDRKSEATVWIDKKNFLVRQISNNPDWGPSITAKLWYTRVAGKYWLPRSTAATVAIPPMPGERVDSEKKPAGPTIVTLKFSNYRVNTGLSDKIFEKKEGGK